MKEAAIMKLERRPSPACESVEIRIAALVDFVTNRYIAGSVVPDRELAAEFRCSLRTFRIARKRAVERGLIQTQALTGRGGGIGYSIVGPCVSTSTSTAPGVA